MSNEVNSLSTQAEKILDVVSDHIGFLSRSDVDSQIDRAAVLVELAKAHAIVELADAIRETISVSLNFDATTQTIHVKAGKE